HAAHDVAAASTPLAEVAPAAVAVEPVAAPTARASRATARPPARTSQPPPRQRTFLPPAWSEEEGSRRGPLTLAVIILVIVATLTMSYLMRRPSYSGDGVTAAPAERASVA
ncbi:MAG TPA: hypothetical protein VKZ63_21520, partial [Kofleriaceae bacterium]|nr:hypothetical protein [Kofleriaceae bacterium]